MTMSLMAAAASLPWWATMLISVATAVLTLIATTVTSYILNSPKRAKVKKEAEHKDILDKIEEVKNHLSARDDYQDEQRNILHKDVGLLKIGTQIMLKNDLKLRYEHWLSKGYAPIDSKEDLEKMYQAYHSLGANGVMDSMRTEFLALPDERVVKNRRRAENGRDIDPAKG